MFITTTSNASALDPKRRLMTWQGPRILIALSDGQAVSDWIASAELYYLVIDLAASPVSRFDAIRIAITRTARERIEMRGPLLFCNKNISDNEVGRLERAAAQDPWLIESTTDPVDGELSILVLGERIVTNPLFKNFFNNLHEDVTQMQTAGCLALLEKHLVWRKKGQTR